MPRTITLFTVWVSSPSDTQDERNCLRQVIDNLNKQVASKLDLMLELQTWEALLQSSSSRSPQETINASVNENDIFVGILRNRLGMPLPTSFGNLTGTEYEFKVALDSFRQTGVPRVLIYVSNGPIGVDNVAALDQLRRLSEFRRSLRTEGFFRDFGDKEEFARQVHQDIARFLADWASRCKTSSPDTTSVFISYVREDSELITSLASQFAVVGIRPWYDTSQLTGGDDWVKKIADAIEEAHVFLLVASQSTLNSRWVRREVEFADRKSKPIIPVEVGQVQWPNWFELQLGSLQRLPLENSGNQGQVDKVVSAIRAARSA
jgi:TIR domain/Domain of unknown function (DUF4062)